MPEREELIDAIVEEVQHEVRRSIGERASTTDILRDVLRRRLSPPAAEPAPVTWFTPQDADNVDWAGRLVREGSNLNPENRSRAIRAFEDLASRLRLASSPSAGGVTGASECQHRFHDRGPRSEAEGENGCPACGEWWARERAAAAAALRTQPARNQEGG